MAQKNYTAERQDYKTPPSIYGELLRLVEKNYFTLDVCCSEDNIPASYHYYDWLDDGLKLHWKGVSFMNPPFRYARQWIIKAFQEMIYTDCILMILPADRTETKYYQDFILQNEKCFFAFVPNKAGFIIPGCENDEPIPSQKIMIAVFCHDEKEYNRLFERWNCLRLFNTTAFKGNGKRVIYNENKRCFELVRRNASGCKQFPKDTLKAYLIPSVTKCLVTDGR